MNLLKPGIFALVFAASPFAAAAASIGSGPFTTTFSSDGNVENVEIAPNSVAGFCDPTDGFGCDGGVSFFGSRNLFVDWVDGDSFDVGFFDIGADAFSISMTGLALTDGSDPVSLAFSLFSGDPFNGLNVDDFLESDENPDGASLPDITSLLTIQGDGTFDIEVSVSSISNQLSEDGPTLRFDLLTQGSEPPEVIPLPAGGLLMMTGLVAFGAVRRRRKS